jgi:hypothetical protein
MIIRITSITDLNQLVFLLNGYKVFYSKPSDIEAAKVILSERISKNESQIFVAVENN